MTLSELRQVAKGDYGLPQTTTADDVFTDAVLNTRINRAHRWLAAGCKLYRRAFTGNLPQGSGGISTFALDPSVFEVDPSTVRVLNGSTWQRVSPSDERTLTQLCGPVEEWSSDTPRWFWCEERSDGGTVLSAEQNNRTLTLAPGAPDAVTNGLRFDAWVYPAELTADGHIPPFPAAEHDLLLPVICWEMAKLELSTGRTDAPVLLYQQQADAARVELLRRMQRFRNPGPRRVRMRDYDEGR